MSKPGSNEAAEETAGDFISLAVRAIVLLVLLIVPFKIVRYGYLPVGDDPVADAAKAVTNRPWADILVLKPYFEFDPHIGWHALLHAVYSMTAWSTPILVVFAVMVSFVALAWSALPWFSRPEAWLASLVIAIGFVSGFTERLMLGRPFLISAAVLVSLLCIWYAHGDAAPSRKSLVMMTALFAIAVLLHGSWYLWLLPIAAFVFAGQYEWAKRVALAWIAGTLIGAVLTLHPITYLAESVRMGLEAFGHHAVTRTLVSEFQPTRDSVPGFLMIGALLVFRRLSGIATKSLRTNPAFWLACMGLVLGYQATRFWSDWGLIALLVVVAHDIQAFMTEHVSASAVQRLAIALGLSATLYLMTTNDADSRWTSSRETLYLSQNNPELAGWLPDAGGVLYAAEMSIFYQTFFLNPDAPWKYMVGFEPAMMPDADFAIYQYISLNHGNPLAYMPWIKTMRPSDRVVLHWVERPSVPELEWKNVNGFWLGRLPATTGAKVP